MVCTKCGEEGHIAQDHAWNRELILQDRLRQQTPMYLTKKIEEVRTVEAKPRLTCHGYSVRAGSPSSKMVRLEGEKRWRRVMVFQFSNAGSAFVRINGVPHFLTSEVL